MSLPVEADFAIIKIGNGATPTEVFTTACGIQDVVINRTANSADRFVRDCANPGEIPYRKSKVTSEQLDVTGSGWTDKAHVDIFEDALGLAKNYKVELYADNGSNGGLLLGTLAAAFVMTAANMNIPRDGDSTADITLSSHGNWTWTAV